MPEKDGKNDKNLESPEWKLNLSQMQQASGPRVHWAISPLSKSSNALQEADENEDGGNRQDSLKERDLKFGIGLQTRAERLLDLGGSKERKSKLPKSLTGLLRSKSTSCSPLASQSSKVPRVYASPISRHGSYVTTNEPSSSSQPNGGSSPLRKMKPLKGTPLGGAELIGDIEDAIGGLGSSFFSEGEVEKKQVIDDLELDAFDFLEPICESLDSQANVIADGPIHRRVHVRQMTQMGGFVQLTGTDLGSMVSVQIQVRGEWVRCLPRESESFIVHLISDDLMVADDHGFLVTFPDTLVSATLVADSITCTRRAVLSTRTQASVEDNKPSAALICGSIVHEILEKSFLSERYDAGFLDSLIPAEISKSLTNIFCAEVEQTKIVDQIQQILQSFPEWAKAHLPGVKEEVEPFFEDTKVTIGKVLKCEENVWSHAFGIKGKIDGTVLIRCPEDGQLILAPLELKTGHSTTSIAHRAQCLLYGFMLWDRYRQPVKDSLLFYVAKANLFRLHPSRTDLKALIMTRNALAQAVDPANRTLPPIISNKHMCKNCFQLESCTLLHKVIEKGTGETAPSAEHFQMRTGHLSEAALMEGEAFYRKWEKLVWLEEQETVRGTRELWSMSAKERELCGRCIGGLKLVGCQAVEDASTFAGYECQFVRDGGGLGDVMVRSQLSEGDPIVVSALEKGHFGLAIGYLLKLGQDSLSVVVDRPIEMGKDVFGRSIDLFRIDKDELSSSYGLLRTNLLKVFAPEQDRLMRLVVMLEAPQFVTEQETPTLRIPSELFDAFGALDACQRDVTRRALAAKDYLLVLGMPGTGKSTTLAFIIRLLVALGKSVLLTSHTHSAVDNILLKIDGSVRFVRLGNPEKIPKSLHHSVFECQKFDSLPHLESFFMTAPLIACTTLAVNKALLAKRSFDICIIDEASQISVPACLGPLRFASSFMLVGDHYQLPPLVRSREAVGEGLQKSLFAVLADAHPVAVAMLRLQYRMNADIMAISNRFVYSDMLTCGNEAVATATMSLPQFSSFQCVQCGTASCWLKGVIDPIQTVLFLDTDKIGAHESPSGNSFQNPKEAHLIQSLLAALLSSGAPQEALTVISPYRPQLKLLQDAHHFPRIDMATVDKFQGRDASCVIISLVRSNLERRIGALLKDWSRLNVAFTRAKCKLILVGSLSTMASDESMGRLCEMFGERKWIQTVPSDYLDHHPIFFDAVKQIWNGCQELKIDHGCLKNKANSLRKRYFEEVKKHGKTTGTSPSTWIHFQLSQKAFARWATKIPAHTINMSNIKQIEERRELRKETPMKAAAHADSEQLLAKVSDFLT